MRADGALLAAYYAAWNASTLPTLVPGKLWFDRAPERGADGKPIQSPYAEIRITPRVAEYNSSNAYLQTFAVEMTVWSVAGATDAGTIGQQIGLTFDPPAGNAVPPALVVAGALVVRVDAEGGTFELDPARRQSQDVMLAAASWNVLLWIPR